MVRIIEKAYQKCCSCSDYSNNYTIEFNKRLRIAVCRKCLNSLSTQINDSIKPSNAETFFIGPYEWFIANVTDNGGRVSITTFEEYRFNNAEKVLATTGIIIGGTSYLVPVAHPYYKCVIENIPIYALKQFMRGGYFK